MTRPQSSFKTPPQAYDQVRPAPLPPGVFLSRERHACMNVACGLPQELATDFWDDDGTEEWRTAWEQTQAAGGCLLTAPARL